MEKILNSKGEPILLNERETRVADINQRMVNALGFEISVTTLTTIVKKITEQKFFQIPFADYIPVVVGNGAWGSNLTTYRSFSLGDDFETGIINTAVSNGRLAATNVGVDSLNVKILNWAKEHAWTLFELELANKSGNWDVVTAKEKARKKNWDLGIQQIAFLGAKGDTAALGLLNQSGVTVNTTRIPAALSGLSVVDLKAFCAGVLDDYRSNCNRTAWPTHFVIPESDYLGLAGPASAQFPVKSVMEQLLETFKTMTQNQGFKILPLAYADLAYNNSNTTTQRYCLYNYDEESIRMDLPVDYTASLMNTINNFQYQNVGYGQFTGVLAYRPAEMLYFDFTP